MVPLVLREILEVFVNTLTGDGMYPVKNCQDLPLHIHMQLSEKQENFFLTKKLFHFPFLNKKTFPFLESTSNFKHFKRKDDRHRQFISEITNCEKLGYKTF